MSTIGSPRRHYLLKRIFAAQSGGDDSAAVWQAKQEAQPGTPLPASFPFLTELAAVGYVAKEDLIGADATELNRTANINARQAAAIFAALAAL